MVRSVRWCVPGARRPLQYALAYGTLLLERPASSNHKQFAKARVMEQPRWLAHAWAELGQREVRGVADNPRIRAFYRDAGQKTEHHDEVPWCAAFVGACLERAGLSSMRSLMARSYLHWGAPIANGRYGAIAVLSRGADPAAGHVGFLPGETANLAMACTRLGGARPA